MTVDEAKRRLAELGRESRASRTGFSLSNPAVRSGAFLLAGALLGRRLGRRRNGDAHASLAGTVSQLALTAAPLLLEQLIRGVLAHNARGPANGTRHD